MAYNLLTEPWIPVLDRKNRFIEQGIVDVLLNAPDLVAISDPAPPIEFGILRMLTAFVMDAWEVENGDDVIRLLNAGKFDRDTIDNYVSRWGNRFDLFQPEHPFYQVPATGVDPKETEPVARLLQHIPAGNFTTFFHHVPAASQAFSPAVCARGLCTIPSFMTAGGRGYAPSINGAPPWYVEVVGRSLFETLILNICGKELPTNIGTTPPVWRSDEEVQAGAEINQFSLLQGLTWQSRRVHLFPAEGGRCTYTGKPSNTLVREIAYSGGYKARGSWTDPQVAYEIGSKGANPLRPKEGRVIWRDIGPLMLLRQRDYTNSQKKVSYERPVVVQQYIELQRESHLPKTADLIIKVYGLRTDKMKIFEWHTDQLALPLDVALNDRAGKQIQEAMEHAETCDYFLRAAIRLAYPREGEGAKDPYGTLQSRASNLFWTELYEKFEHEIVAEGIAKQDPSDPNAPATLLDGWKKHLKKVGAQILDRTLSQLDADAEEITRAVNARDFFGRIIHNKFFPPPAGTKKTAKPAKKRSTKPIKK